MTVSKRDKFYSLARLADQKSMKIFFVLLAGLLTAGLAHAQKARTAPATGSSTINKKLNLEDITVKGELLSDDRMNFVRRQREELKNRIRFRTNFRAEILQEYKQ